MLLSLLIKLAMLAATAGLVLWIGWPMPSDPGPESSPTGDVNTVTRPAAASLSRETAPPATPSPSKLDLNRASEEDFQQLPGIGPVLAQRMVEWRRQHGAFKQVDELNAVKGIGTKKLQQIRPLVMVGKDKRKETAGSPSRAEAFAPHRNIP